MIKISYILFFFILEPEWNAIFYAYYDCVKSKNSFSLGSSYFLKLKPFSICSIKIKTTISIYHYKFIISNLHCSYSLEKNLLYYFYKVNREFNLFLKKNYFLGDIHVKVEYTKTLTYLFLNAFLTSFDFFSALFCTNSLIVYSPFHVRFSSNFLFIFNIFFGFNSYLFRIQRILFFNFRLFSFDSLFFSDFEIGFTFLGFNFSSSFSLNCLRIIPAKYSILYFLKSHKKLAYLSLNFST